MSRLRLTGRAGCGGVCQRGLERRYAGSGPGCGLGRACRPGTMGGQRCRVASKRQRHRQACHTANAATEGLQAVVNVVVCMRAVGLGLGLGVVGLASAPAEHASRAAGPKHCDWENTGRAGARCGASPFEAADAALVQVVRQHGDAAADGLPHRGDQLYPWEHLLAGRQVDRSAQEAQPR